MGSIVNTTVPLTRIVLGTRSKVKYFIPSNMKIRNLFSFSSQKSTNTCESFQNTGSVQKRDLQSEYILKKILGKGGFGRVFSAVRISDGLEVAVKEVLKDSRYQTDNKTKTDIPTEVALMQQVENIEGVIKILDYIDDTECYYIVMEKINSKDLFDFITDEGPLPENFAKGMFSEIVQTVIQCRDSGVLHRDIKDENILVDLKTYNVKLIDFGSGCEHNHHEEPDKVFKEFRGTRVYSPPVDPGWRIPGGQADCLVPGDPAVQHAVRRHPLHHGPGDLLREAGLASPALPLPVSPGPDSPLSHSRPQEENNSGQSPLPLLLQPTSD